MLAIDAAARRTAAVALSAVQTLRSSRISWFFLGMLAGVGLTVQIHDWWTSSVALCSSVSAGHRQLDNPQADLVLAFTLYPVTNSAGQLAVIAVAVAVLIGFLVLTKRETSASFFWGVLAGTGFVLSFDIVLIHWIFGLHHLTNTQMDIVLEPLFVLLGLAFLWFGFTRERRQVRQQR